MPQNYAEITVISNVVRDLRIIEPLKMVQHPVSKCGRDPLYVIESYGQLCDLVKNLSKKALQANS